ncbi:hypothetical protein F383_30648 [Gossypium arboreum]|uniref:Uncharacterized protein n=1 Tax=Gossypium arboreum TaxID=29729 RepID=A0A0B0PB50_GOSAR|nr:hypothetical protein F383_30648 [Gossypium arboreum]
MAIYLQANSCNTPYPRPLPESNTRC